MKILLLITFAISSLASATDWCYKGNMLYMYEKGVCVDSVKIDLFLKQLETKEQKTRIDVKDFLMNLKECK